MTKKNKILFFFLIWSVWLSAEFLLGPFSHVRIFDNGDSLLPQLIAAKIQFQKYGINYFSAFMVSGVDGAAQGLVPFSNLISALFILLPSWFAYGLLMLVQRFLAGYFTFRLAKDSLKTKVLPATVAGVLFSIFKFSTSYFTIYHAFGIPALPFIIWILEKIITKKSILRYAYLTFFGILIGWSNYFVYFSPYLLPFIFWWFIFIKNQRKLKTILDISLFAIFSIVPMMPNILAIIYNSGSSQRTILNLNSPSMFPQGKFFTAFYTLFDVNKNYWPSLFIAALLFFKFKLRESLSKKLFYSLLLLNIAIFVFILCRPFIPTVLGPIKSFSFDRVELIIPLLLSVLSAIYVNLLPQSKSKKACTLIFIFMFLISLNIKLGTVKNYAPFRSLYDHPDLRGLSENIDSSKWRVATVTGGGIRPAYALANGLNNVDAYLTLYPVNYHKYWSQVISKRIVGDKGRYEDFVDWGGRVYLYGPQNFDSLEKINFESYYNLDMLSYANAKYILSTKAISNSGLALLPSKYRDTLSGWESLSLKDKVNYFISGKFYGRPIYIYENQKALPRFYLEKDGAPLNEEVTILSYSPDKIKLSVNAPANSKLIVVINYYTYWVFKVNGKDKSPQMYPEPFMSVDLEEGENIVSIEYRPPYFEFTRNKLLVKPFN